MRHEVVTRIGPVAVILMDTISMIGEAEAGAVVVSGSHGGRISAAFAVRHRPRLVLFNDAGGGKGDAGRAALPLLDGVGIASATVSHRSARIGDALDAWDSGVISDVNVLAARGNLRVGEAVRASITAFAGAAR